jgi:O-succinylbenzoic acid--CoA ligase
MADRATIERRIDLARDAAVLYTSGTSGRPKGVRLTFGNLWYGAIASALHLGHHRDDLWLAAMPLYHVGGLAILFRGVITGVGVDLHPRFDADRANAAIDRGATLVSVVPTMLQRMLDVRAAAPWPPHLRCVLLGGSAAPVELIERCLRDGLPVAPTYGLTETASQVTTLLPDQAARKPGSSGVPLPLMDVRISSVHSTAGSDQPGEIEVRGPTVSPGYLGNVPDEPGPAAGWFRTGDVGYLDDDCYLFVVDRRDDLIVSGGENIAPAQIERVLLDHPGVVDVGVVGIPDARWGAVPVAAVVWNGDEPVAETDLLAHCAARLAPFKIPTRWLTLAELPRTVSGKLQRRKLREIVLERLAGDRTAGR